MMVYYNVAWWQFRAHTIHYIDELSEGERVGFDSGCRLAYAPDSWMRRWYESAKGTLNPEAVGVGRARRGTRLDSAPGSS